MENNNFQKISTSYKNKNIAEAYDKTRFSSLIGRSFNVLEKRCFTRLLRFLKKEKDIKNVLDIPCGTGRMTAVLVREGFEVMAADISEEMLKVAQKKLSYAKNIVYTVRDIKNTGFANNSFDCVSCIRLFHHIDSQDRIEILRELGRISRHYIIINLSYSSFWHRIRRKFKKLIGQGLSRITVTEKELAESLTKSALEEVTRRSMLPIISEDIFITLRKRNDS